MFDFRRMTLFCLEKRLSKHKMTIKIWGGDGPFGPLGYAYAFDQKQYMVLLRHRTTHHFFFKTRTRRFSSCSSTAPLSSKKQSPFYFFLFDLSVKLVGVVPCFSDANNPLRVQVCGKATEGCDESCGGAGCDTCGGIGCNGAVQFANDAKDRAQTTQETLARISEETGDLRDRVQVSFGFKNRLKASRSRASGGGTGGESPLFFEIWYFSVNFLVKICFS